MWNVKKKRRIKKEKRRTNDVKREENRRKRGGKMGTGKQDMGDFLTVIIASLPVLVQAPPPPHTHTHTDSEIVGRRQFKQL